eukprot:TRINITY_DN10114_c0_g2_i1.p2 TRINITY_DN10114_c0_g2~~TRINITY_DN10114_c0_g2_i1.p2  ORF type:complete len:132 (+),score=4.30 TRINITY_DN10114_c0_g2_i1:1666-2061(+)
MICSSFSSIRGMKTTEFTPSDPDGIREEPVPVPATVPRCGGCGDDADVVVAMEEGAAVGGGLVGPPPPPPDDNVVEVVEVLLGNVRIKLCPGEMSTLLSPASIWGCTCSYSASQSSGNFTNTFAERDFVVY